MTKHLTHTLWLALGLMFSTSGTASAQSLQEGTPLFEELTEWFTNRLNIIAATPDNGFSSMPEAFTKKLSSGEVNPARRLAWKAWQMANCNLKEDKLGDAAPYTSITMASLWNIPASLEPQAQLCYLYGTKGEEPANGLRPLYLYLHGSGPRDQEWRTGVQLCYQFDDAPSTYFIPRIPNEGNYYRWWQKGKLFAWEKLFRLSMASGKIDPARIYLLGISEGGYGSQRLASYYADYLAGAGPMAGGEPLKNAPAENCRYVGFSLLTGAKDYGFHRDRLTRYTAEAFDSLEAMHPKSYLHRVQLVEGRGHAIDYSQTTPWLKHFSRLAHPTEVSWERFDLDGVYRKGFYNLCVEEPSVPDGSEKRVRYEMEIHDNVVMLDVMEVTYRTLEVDSQLGIELKFDRTYAPAHSGKVRLYFDFDMIDFSRPIQVVVNGRTAYKGKLAPTMESMMNSLALFYDPMRIFPASVVVDVE